MLLLSVRRLSSINLSVFEVESAGGVNRPCRLIVDMLLIWFGWRVCCCPSPGVIRRYDVDTPIRSLIDEL